MEPIETWLEQQHLLVPVEHPSFGEYWLPPAKVGFDRLASRRGPAAAVGEHTAALLAELGYEPQQIAALIDKQVVGAGAAPPS
jgi:crotonobetainyl-CoA:carnitine CoA-transferase CaiB-like acyl-CoA transferase